MNLKKKSELKDISTFKDADLFINDEDNKDNSEDENDNQDEENDDDDKKPKFHNLTWVTSSKLYDSAIMVKEINAFI